MRRGARAQEPGPADSTSFNYRNARSSVVTPKLRPSAAKTSSGWGRSLVDERRQLLPARCVAQLAQRLRLDLPDPLACQAEVVPDLLQRALRALPDAEAHPQDLLLPRRQ